MDDDENESPRSRKRLVDDEDDDERPRSKRNRADDDDEMPRSRKRALDDDDDGERPRNKSREDDDEDESPRSRRRPRDDDDDRPRKKKKKTGGLGLKIGLAVAGVAAIAGIVFLMIWLFSGGGSYDTEMIAYLPADSTVVAGADIEELNKNVKLKETVGNFGKFSGQDPLKELTDKLKPAGLTIDDLSRAVLGGSPDKDKDPVTVVLRTKKSFDKAKLADALDCKKEQKKGDITYYTNNADNVVYFPSDTLVVMTNKKHFETLSNKDSSKTQISEELQEISKKMSKGHIWFAVSRNAFPKDFAKKIDAVKIVNIPYVPGDLLEAAKNMKGIGGTARADGDSVKFSLGMLCESSESAVKAETAMKKDIEDRKSKKLDDDPLLKNFIAAPGVPTEVKSFAENLQKSISADRSGALVEMSIDFKISDAEGVSKVFGAQQPPIRNVPENPPKKKFIKGT